MTIQTVKKNLTYGHLCDVDAKFLYQKPNLNKNVKKLLNVTVKDVEHVLNTLGVTQKALDEIVQSIKDWYEKQPHLPQGELHDEVIIRRLITQSFSIERVKEKIDNYYTIRHKMPEVLGNRDPLAPALAKCLKRGYWIVLPKRTPDNKRVTIFNCQATDDLLTDILKVAFIILDYRLWNDDMAGDHWVFDFKGATLNHASQCTPMLIKKIMFALNYCFGPKVVGQYLVNLPPFASTIVSLFKKSMKAKMVQRLYTIDKVEDLFQVIPRNIFPKEYGGDENVSCQDITDEWMMTLQASPWRDYLVEQNGIYSNESKRLSPTKADEIFGLAGSFKKLEFD